MCRAAADLVEHERQDADPVPTSLFGKTPSETVCRKRCRASRWCSGPRNRRHGAGSRAESGAPARRTAFAPDCDRSARIRRQPGQRLAETRSLQTPCAHRASCSERASCAGRYGKLECLPRQTTPDTCLIQQGVDLLGGGEGTVSQQRPRHAAPKRADRRRTPTWCEIVSTLAAVAGVLISLIQLLRG